MDALRTLQNIRGGSGILISQSDAGIFISSVDPILEIDDHNKLDMNYNASTQAQRSCDLKLADIGDQFRIRATTQVDPENEKEVLYKMHLLINRLDSGGEGGFVTDAARPGLDHTKNEPKIAVATPLGRTGQLGDVLILDSGDKISTTKDGDDFVLLNCRHDMHILYDQAHDGRIYFTTTPPGHRPTGIPLIGEMVGDPAKANTDTRLGKESINWCPQLCDTFPPDIQTYPYPIPGAQGYNWPLFRYVSPSTMRAAVFPNSPGTGWSGSVQLPTVYSDDLNYGFFLEYSAAQDGDSSKTAVFVAEYVVVTPNGETMSIMGATGMKILVTIPPVCSEDELYHKVFPVVPGNELLDGDTIVLKIFYRDTGNYDDNFEGEVLLEGFKSVWCDTEPIPAMDPM